MQSILSVFVLFFAVMGSCAPPPAPEAVQWEVFNDKNQTCFMANMGVEWHVTYTEKLDDKSSKDVEKVFSFDDPSQLMSAVCNRSEVELVFSREEANQTLKLSFTSDNETNPTMYWLSSVMLSYNVTSKEFENAANIGTVVTAEALPNSFNTSTEMSYQCSIESQLRLNSSAPKDSKNIYVRFTPPSNGSLQLQATTFKTNATYGDESKCFWDMPRENATVNTYKAKASNATCGMLQSSLELSVSYNTIHGTTMQTMIPVGKNATEFDSTCGNVTTINAMLQDDIGNVTFVFKKTSVKQFSSFYDSTVEESLLSSITFVYNTASDYFPNHGSMNETMTVTNATLSEFKSPIGMSYKCYVPTDVMVTGELKATFNRTQLQPFNVKNDSFAKASDCQAGPATTTNAPMTTKPIKPEPYEPSAYNRTLKDDKDKKTICLNTFLGLQMTMSYQKKSDPAGTLTPLYFNYDPDNCTTTAVCDDKTATVNFTRTGDYNQWIVLTFAKDGSTNTTYLSQVDVSYEINKYFPDAKDVGTKTYTMKNMKYFEVPDKKAYACTTERDILMNTDPDMTTVRMTGLKIDAFAASEKFPSEQECFSDMPPPTPTTGTYYIINSTAQNNSVCAAFKLAVTANVTYMQLVDTMPKTVYIPIPGSDHTPRDGSFGVCEENKTTLVIPMDDGKLNFTFVFTKKNVNGGNFMFSMTEATLSYSTDSKYFPNHEYIKGGMEMYSNKSLDLFSSDQDHSYKCNQNTSNGIADGVKMSFSNVQVQPFGVGKSDGSFKSADECTDDDLSPLIPIIVGSVLAGLVVIVLVAYVIGRRRNRGPSYESI